MRALMRMSLWGVCALSVLLAGCRSQEDLAIQEADARVRTCVSLIERGVGWRIAAEREVDDPERPGADWPLLVDDPDEYYGQLVEVVSIAAYLEIAERGQTVGTFRSNSREMKAGCPLP